MIDRLEPEAIKLLKKACFLKEDYFMCFGKYYYQLYKLDLIDDELGVTLLGRKFIRYCMDLNYFKEDINGKRS